MLNANRTYYLTRSQPPFLSSMVLAVYEAKKKPAKGNGLAGKGLWPCRPRLRAVGERPHLAGTPVSRAILGTARVPSRRSLAIRREYYRRRRAIFSSCTMKASKVFT